MWIIDFALRIKQLQDVRKSKDFNRSDIWLGGMFIAEAYITATRQAAAQSHGWSVENLELQVEVLDDKAQRNVDDTCFIARGLTLEGASWNAKNKCLVMTNEISMAMSIMKFKWAHKPPKEASAGAKEEPAQAGPPKASLPVYLSETRSEFLFAVDLNASPEVPVIAWHQRGVALNVWKPNI